MKTIDINSDLGEGYGRYRVADDEALMPRITSANIACGFHAGDPVIMRRTAELAVANGVRIGAHIGYPDVQGFGRRAVSFDAKELSALTLYQLGAMRAMAEAAGGTLGHVNFHGALGNLSFADEDVAHAVLQAVKDYDPTLKYVTLPFTAAARVAESLGLETVNSFLADRAYTPEGLLASRKQPGAMVTDTAQIRARVARLLSDGEIETVDGSVRRMPVDSILVHSDTAGALDIATAVREAIDAAGYSVRAF
ncbi:Lactam utilization protein LamB [plant metagenome]|uniref:Lactam utilization protein LamB n=1 Tax=plant metagenome TaxID=1297885 RepID=A0A484PBX1_9ZZZZ